MAISWTPSERSGSLPTASDEATMRQAKSGALRTGKALYSAKVFVGAQPMPPTSVATPSLPVDTHVEKKSSPEVLLLSCVAALQGTAAHVRRSVAGVSYKHEQPARSFAADARTAATLGLVFMGGADGDAWISVTPHGAQLLQSLRCVPSLPVVPPANDRSTAPAAQVPNKGDATPQREVETLWTVYIYAVPKTVEIIVLSAAAERFGTLSSCRRVDDDVLVSYHDSAHARTFQASSIVLDGQRFSSVALPSRCATLLAAVFRGQREHQTEHVEKSLLGNVLRKIDASFKLSDVLSDAYSDNVIAERRIRGLAYLSPVKTLWRTFHKPSLPCETTPARQRTQDAQRASASPASASSAVKPAPAVSALINVFDDASFDHEVETADPKEIPFEEELSPFGNRDLNSCVLQFASDNDDSVECDDTIPQPRLYGDPLASLQLACRSLNGELDLLKLTALTSGLRGQRKYTKQQLLSCRKALYDAVAVLHPTAATPADDKAERLELEKKEAHIQTCEATIRSQQQQLDAAERRLLEADTLIASLRLRIDNARPQPLQLRVGTPATHHSHHMHVNHHMHHSHHVHYSPVARHHNPAVLHHHAHLHHHHLSPQGHYQHWHHKQPPAYPCF